MLDETNFLLKQVTELKVFREVCAASSHLLNQDIKGFTEWAEKRYAELAK